MFDQSIERIEPNVRWPDVLQYNKIKDQWLRTQIDWSASGLRGAPFDMYSSAENRLFGTRATDLLNHFNFGTHMVHLLFHREYVMPNLEGAILPSGYKMGLWAPQTGQDVKFLVDWNVLENIIKNPAYEQPQSLIGRGPPIIKTPDFFEIAGVEEGAHYIFEKEKGELHSMEALAPNKTHLIEYNAQNHETRGLLWRTLYTKHYFPEYYVYYKQLYDEVIQFRATQRANSASISQELSK